MGLHEIRWKIESLVAQAGFQALTGHRWLLASLLDSTDLEGRKDDRKRATGAKVRGVHGKDKAGPGLLASPSLQDPGDQPFWALRKETQFQQTQQGKAVPHAAHTPLLCMLAALSPAVGAPPFLVALSLL